MVVCKYFHDKMFGLLIFHANNYEAIVFNNLNVFDDQTFDKMFVQPSSGQILTWLHGFQVVPTYYATML